MHDLPVPRQKDSLERVDDSLGAIGSDQFPPSGQRLIDYGSMSYQEFSEFWVNQHGGDIRDSSADMLEQMKDAYHVFRVTELATVEGTHENDVLDSQISALRVKVRQRAELRRAQKLDVLGASLAGELPIDAHTMLFEIVDEEFHAESDFDIADIFIGHRHDDRIIRYGTGKQVVTDRDLMEYEYCEAENLADKIQNPRKLSRKSPGESFEEQKIRTYNFFRKLKAIIEATGVQHQVARLQEFLASISTDITSPNDLSENLKSTLRDVREQSVAPELEAAPDLTELDLIMARLRSRD